MDNAKGFNPDNVKAKKEPIFHLVKRDDLKWWQAWLIRLCAILFGLLIIAIISMVLTGKNFFSVFETMNKACFGNLAKGNTKMLWPFLKDVAVLLGLSVAITPAFKMKFWNCGAEGQALIGGLAAMMCMIELGDVLPYPILIIAVVLSSILAGAVWGVLPAIFKAQYNTNETLFTLMMNYVAIQFVKYYLYLRGGGSNVISGVQTGHLPKVANNDYILTVLVLFVITILIFFYLKSTKHGYEISVVGESQNTARYIGINVKKVVIRTMIISGALCGIVGMLLVSGISHSINADTIEGQGFTAIMVSWLGQFNPLIMIFMSTLVIYLDKGVGKIANSSFVDASFSDIAVGLFIFIVVACEFFIHYSIKFRGSKREAKV